MAEVPILGSVRQGGPLDVPLPTLVVKAMTYLIAVGGPNELVLRYTPIMMVGPGQFAPTQDHHTELVFAVDNVVGPGGLLSLMAKNMTPEEISRAASWFKSDAPPPSFAPDAEPGA